MTLSEESTAEVLCTDERTLSTGVDGKFRNLDLMRSLAVLAVLFDHSFRLFGVSKFWPIGRAGVLLFFVHTALVLMLSLERRGSSARQFYIQRVFRIYPLCLAAIAACLLFQIPSEPLIDDLSFQWGGWGWLCSNVLLIQNLTGATSISGPLWSLPFEIQMYFVLPFVYLVAKGKRPRLNIALLSLGSAIAILALSFVLDCGLQRIVAWPVPCFLGGVIAFTLFGERRLFPAALLPVTIAGFIAANLAIPRMGTYWLSCTLLGVLLPRFRELRNAAVTSIFERIAKYSYGIYLSHILLMWLCFRVMPFALPIRCTVFVCLLLIIPVLAYRVIEHPMIRLGRRISAPTASAHVMMNTIG